MTIKLSTILRNCWEFFHLAGTEMEVKKISFNESVKWALAQLGIERSVKDPHVNRVPFKQLTGTTIEHFYQMRFGGTKDALSTLSFGAGILSSAPLLAPHFSSFPMSIAPFASCAAGSAWLAWRLSEPWRKQHILSSTLKIRSDVSPMDFDHEENMKGMLLGYTCDGGKPVVVPDELLTRHIFIGGQSGVGKTVAASLLMYQQIQRGGGLLFIDGKVDQDNINQLYHYCCFAGRPQDLFVINPDDPNNSNTYNPVLYGDADEKADGLLQLIPSTESNAGADFYKQEAKQALTTLIRALQTARKAYNMIDLTVLLMNSNALLELEKDLKSRAPNSDALSEYALFLDKFRVPPSNQNPLGGIDMKKLKDVFGGIGGRLYSFGTGKFGQVMNTYTPDVTLFDAIMNNKIVYFALPTMGKDTTARNFGKLIIADLRTAISWIQKLPQDERPDPPFLAFCDEAGSYVNESWSRIPEQARSARVFFVPATQTAANFKAISDELFEMVIGNAWVKMFFKIGTQASALEYAELIGKRIAITKSLADSETKSSSTSFLRHNPESNVGAGSAINYGEREQEAYIVSPEDLKGLGMGECVVIIGGDQVYNIRIPMTKFDSNAKKRFGEFKVNRFRQPGKIIIDGEVWQEAGYFENVDRYLSTSIHQLQKDTEAADAEDAEDMRKLKSKADSIQASRSNGKKKEKLFAFDDE